ncbi:hypothetical protein ACHWQZ_G008198 [Mnemiopsis leidyi]
MGTNELADLSSKFLTRSVCDSLLLNTTNETAQNLGDFRTCQLLTSDVYRLILPVLGITLGVACVTLNSLVGAFFHSKTDQVMHLIYFCLACSDFVSGIVAIYQGVAVMLTEWMFPAARLQLYSVFYVLGQLPFHVSAFINVLLTVARTTSIFLPLYRIRHEYIKLGVLAYSVVWAGLIVADWIIANNLALYFFDWKAVVGILYVYPRPGGLVIDETFYRIDSESYKNGDFKKVIQVLVMLVTVFFPYGLPSIICLISAIMQVKQIFLNSSTQNREKSTKRNRKMSITIIILTGVFFICNTAYLMAMITDMEIELDESDHYQRQFVLLVASNHLLYLNSALTPLILILRGSTMQEYVKRHFSLRHVSNNSRSSVSNSFNNHPGTKV